MTKTTTTRLSSAVHHVGSWARSLRSVLLLLAIFVGALVAWADSRYQKVESAKTLEQTLNSVAEVVFERALIDTELSIRVLETQDNLSSDQRRNLEELRIKREQLKTELKRVREREQ